MHYLTGSSGRPSGSSCDAGADVQFVPADFRRFARIAQRSPRVMATAAAPPDADGYLSLSLHAGATVARAAPLRRRPRPAADRRGQPQVPAHLRHRPDHPHRLHLDEIDVLVKPTGTPSCFADAEPTDVERAIAELAGRFVPDGATLQTGIGGIPSTSWPLLAEGDGGDYGIHSEMFTTGLMRLHQAGKVTNPRKGIYDGFSITTFAAGIPELYEWLDGDESCASCRSTS